MRAFVSRAIALFRRASLDRELDDEIAAHLEMATAANMAKGMSAEDARLAARRSFGGVTQTKEAYRDRRGFPFLEALWQDTRYALRALRRSPGFATAAILILTLAIGANTALFAVVDQFLIQPLPYRDASRLVVVDAERQYAGSPKPSPILFSLDGAEMLRHALHTTDSVVAFEHGRFQLATADGSEIVPAAVVSPDFFRVLDGPIVAGRALAEADDPQPDAVISERLALRLFGSPPNAIGRQLAINSDTYAIVGVAGNRWSLPSPDTEIWTPTGYNHQRNPTACCFVQLLARMKPGLGVLAVRNDVESATRRLASVDPRAFHDLHVKVTALRDHLLGDTKSALLVLWGAVSVVLFLACANVLNLIGARNAARAREMGIRAALGASRHRLVLQGVAEAGVLAGAAVGLVLLTTRLLVTVFVRLDPQTLTSAGPIGIDGRVLVFAIALGVSSMLAAGIVPALRTAMPSIARASTPAGKPRRRRLQQALCVGQFAAALVLIVAAALFGRSLAGLLRTDLGVVSDHLLTASVNLAFGRRHTDAEAVGTFDRIIARVREMPGVQAVGFGTSLPPDTSRLVLTLRRQGGEADYAASGVASTPGYFPAMGIRLLKGRIFTDSDDADHQPVIILSASTAQRFFAGADVIGQTLDLPVSRNGSRGHETMTIVGVVGDVKYSGIQAAAGDQAYRPLAQQPWISGFLAVRTLSDPLSVASEVRKAIADVDPTVPVSAVTSLDEIVSRAITPPRFRAVLLGAFALLGLAIGAIGLYGLVAYSVSQRTMELGVRMALGASRTDVVRLVLLDTLTIATVGIAVGVPLALAASRGFAALLFGVTAHDVTTYAVSAAALMGVALAAGYAPARRATRVDPAVALRAE